MIFLTESGYPMIVKSFMDDLAWKVQRELVKTYFMAIHMESHYNDMLVEMLDSQEDIKKKLNCLEKKFNSYEKKLTKLENGFDSQEKKLELEFTHILNYFKLCISKIDDI